MKNYDYIWSDESQMEVPVRNDDNPKPYHKMRGRRSTTGGRNMRNSNDMWNNDDFDKSFDRFEKTSNTLFKFAGAWIAFCMAAGIALTIGVIWLLIVLIHHFS